MLIAQWFIKSNDRVGMVKDILCEFSREGANIIKMEVDSGQIFIKFGVEGKYNSKKMLYQRLIGYQDIKEIKDINFLPQCRKNTQFETIIKSDKEGIIGLTNTGIVKYCNTVFLDYFDLTSNEILGLHINEFFNDLDSSIFINLLTGSKFSELQLNTKKGAYLCSGDLMLDESEKEIYALIKLKKSPTQENLIESHNNYAIKTFGKLIYVSPKIEEVVNIAKKIADSNCTVLIKGETGTGKELFARAIHNASKRKDHPFSPINCAALPETLLESELFGYEKGAFTGANKTGKKGLFESTNNGTIFLDEFGELPLNLQCKLLRVLQDNVIRRIGGTEYITVDVRIIVATNRNLEQMVRENQFREDLFYRINIIPIDIPSLRNRREDISLLLKYFLAKYCDEFNKKLTLSSDAKKYLMTYSWPGNVRELQNMILRAVHLATNSSIKMEELLINRNNLKNTSDLKQTVQEIEKEMIEKMLIQFGTARAVARAIGLSHTAVLKKIKKYGI